MRKIILTVGQGSFEKGFDVYLDIPGVTKYIGGRLPGNPAIQNQFTAWQESFLSTIEPTRTKPKIEATADPQQTVQGTRDREEKQIAEHATNLCSCLKKWFDNNDDSWLPIRDKIGTTIDKTENEEIRMLIATDDFLLQKLPWSAWGDLFKHKLLQIALSRSGDHAKAPVQDSIKILAVFGEGRDLNLQADKDKLKVTCGTMAEIEIIDEKEKLTKQYLMGKLREKPGWQIFFYAGHSSIDAEGKIGSIDLMSDRKIKINELHSAFEEAITNGLKLAIFNSCDGLGLANQLAEKDLPYSIVMSQPIPDQCATVFLKVFLENFVTKAQSIYASVREARFHLESFKDQYPGIMWVPVLFQNPALVELEEDWNPWDRLYQIDLHNHQAKTFDEKNAVFAEVNEYRTTHPQDQKAYQLQQKSVNALVSQIHNDRISNK